MDATNEISEAGIAADAELLHERIHNGHTAKRSVGRNRGDDTNAKSSGTAILDELEAYVDVDRVGRYVRFDTWPDDERLPDWVADFSDMVDHLSDVDDPNSEPEGFGHGVPFEEIFSRIVLFSRQRFVDDGMSGPLSNKAIRDIEKQLLDRLVDIGAQSLHIDFITYIAERDLKVVEDDRRSRDSTRWYESYVSDFFDGRLVDFFEQYPVLARLIIVVSRQWGAARSSFASRLERDYHSVSSLFDTEHLGPVISIDLGAGDPHEQGRTVLIAEFESGHEIVYKPRNIEAEKQLYEFESWLSQRFDNIPDLRTPEVISRSAYGWVEKVESTSFADGDSVEEYYRRAGVLLFVLYLLNTSDCHFENVIATDGSPVVVDAETILQTDISTAKSPRSRINRRLKEHVAWSSVLRTMMLPFKKEGMSGSWSGLGMVEEQDSTVRKLSWTHVNSDAIDVKYQTETVVPESNYPTLGGGPVPPGQFVDEIVDGFTIAYEAILSSREQVAEYLTRNFEGVPVRNVLQDTKTYQALLDTLTNPEYLRSAVKHSYKIEKTLSEAREMFTSVEQPDWVDDIVGAERQSVFRRDVPRFLMQTDSNEIYTSDGTLSLAVLEKTGMELTKNRIKELSEEDKEYQRGLIRACVGNPNLGDGGHHGGDG